jgi:predicted amidohydrolase
MKLSLYQMQPIVGDPQQSLEKVKEMANRAKVQGSELLVLPEYWSTGLVPEYIQKNIDQISQVHQEGLSEISKMFGIGIVAASPLYKDGKIFNAALLFDPFGEIIGEYDKVHLFQLMGEDRYLHPGSRLSVHQTAWGSMGLAICYDLRFPELFRVLTSLGAELIIIPAYWPELRIAHWQLLILSRAVENQVFVVGCNCSRLADGSILGSSMIVDPEGSILIQAGKEEVLMTVDIDLNRVHSIRSNFPVWDSRRIDLYG